MPKEMEVKVLNIDKEKLEKRLRQVGAKLVKKEFQINTIFDTKNRKIKQVQEGYLRIRESKDLLNGNTSYIFTLKKNISKDGLRENVEIETEVKDAKALTSILESLDLSIIHKGEKERITYLYDAIRFDIDTWDKDTYPTPYLEIEVEEREDLEKAINILDLNRNDVTTKSLGELRMGLGIGDL